MKRCPKCNRTYTTDTQKFCTHDGGLLVAFESGQGETIRIDSAQLSDAPTKAISRELVSSQFDPYQTVLERPEATTAARGRDTQDLTPPAPPAQPPPHTSAPLPPSQPLPTSGSLSGAGSGPIGTSAALPQPSSASGPITTSAPLPPQVAGTSQARPVRPLVAPRPARKSRVPLVLGILAVLFVLGVAVLGAAYVVVFRPMLARRNEMPARIESPQPQIVAPAPTSEAPPSDSENASINTVNEPPFTPPANAVEFVNSSENLDGKLAEHYVDFSFYYPNNWIKDPTAGVPGASNFAKVERRLPPDFTQENFAVGWYSSLGSNMADRALYPTLAENLSSQFEKNFPEYRKVSQGEAKAGVYEGYEFRFEAFSRDTAKGDLKIWGRAVFLPPRDGGKNGVTLLMLATSLAPELKSVNDLGVKGEMPMILDSFRFGQK